MITLVTTGHVVLYQGQLGYLLYLISFQTGWSFFFLPGYTCHQSFLSNFFVKCVDSFYKSNPIHLGTCPYFLLIRKYNNLLFLLLISRYLCTSSCCRFKYRCNSYQEIRWVTDSVLTSQSHRPVSMRSNKYMKMIPSVREPKWKILIWLTQWMVLLQQNSTRRPLTSKHFYGGSFCSKNKQITTVLNVVYKSAPKLFLEIQVISRSWVQWTVVSFTWQPLSRKLRTIMIMALVCTWWRQLMETRAICLLCVQLMLKSQEMLLSRILLQ